MPGRLSVLSSDSLPVEHAGGRLLVLRSIVDDGCGGDCLDPALVLGRWALQAPGTAAAGTLARGDGLRLSHVPCKLAIVRNRLITHNCKIINLHRLTYIDIRRPEAGRAYIFAQIGLILLGG